EINERVCEMLGVIVVKVLSCLHIRSVSECMVYPEPNPPYYNEETIIMTLDYLAQNFNDDSGDGEFSLAAVLAKIPNGLHEVFLSLSSTLWREHHAHEQNRCLHMMGIFVRLVLKEIKPGGVARGGNQVVSDSAAQGIIRDILNRLLVILCSRASHHTKASTASPSYEEDVILTCLKILQDVCCSVLENCPQELVQFLQGIVDAVANVAGMSEAVGQSALQILLALTAKGLREESSFPTQLVEALSLLNPLPPVPALAELRTLLERSCSSRNRPLSQLLDDFLTVSDMTASCPSQGLALRLKNLSSSIAVNHTEIQNLVSSAKGLRQVRGLIQQLSNLCTSSSQTVATAAASCLGAIGPVNLQILSLNFDLSSRKDSFQGDTKAQEFEKYHWLFQVLDACLLDKSLEIVSTASRILRSIMATESSKQFEKYYIKLTKSQGSLFRYLQPFKNSPPDLLEPDPSPSQDFDIMGVKELWLGERYGSPYNENMTHDRWIKDVVKSLLSTDAVKDEVLSKIGPLCALKEDICASSLPYLIHEILSGDNERFKKILSQQFVTFFALNAKRQTVRQEKYSLVMNKTAVRTMLSVVQYLRTQKRSQQSLGETHTAWHNNFWLDLHYLHVAQAAQYCGASFSAVLFIEIYCGIKRQALEAQQSSSDSTSGSQNHQKVPADFLTPEDAKVCQELLMDAYKTIDDPDGIYGCGAGKQANIMTRVETYMHELQQEKALITLDIAMCNDPTLDMTHLLQVVQSCGADFILQQCLPKMQSQIGSSSSPSCKDELNELFYQAAWKLGQWDLCLPQGQASQSPFHESVYQCLHCIKDGHMGTGFDCLHAARLNAIRSFDPMAETCSQLYPFLSRLQCLGYLHQVLEKFKKRTMDGSFVMDNPKMPGCQMVEFRFQEVLLQLMSATGRVLESQGVREGEALEIKALWDLALGGRKAKNFQVAERAIQSLHLKQSTNGGGRDLGFTQHQLQLEEAKLFWARSEQATSSLQTLEAETYLQSLVLYGNWLAETKSETPSKIMDFFQTAVNTILRKGDDSTSGKTALHAFVSLATYADEQYQLIADYMQSPVYEEKCRLVMQSMSEVEEYQKLHVKNSITVETMKRNFMIDEQEVAALQSDRDEFLHQALDGYLQCLVRGNSHDLRISRVLALWFDNSAIKSINSLIGKYVPKLQSHKFLLLFYQLAARMGVQRDGSGFNSTLTKLLERIAVEHPHHSLWVVLALAHAHKDSEFTAGDNDHRKGRRRGSTGGPVIEEERVQAAKDLLDCVGRTKSRRAGVHLDQIVDGMRRFSLACIQLANMRVDKKGVSQSYTVPSSHAIVKLQNLEHVQVPIVELAIDPSGSYTDLVSLVKFERTFLIAGGINLPKIIGLICSDGTKRTSLVKGRDDMRQDAVMQQVFSLVNQLLAADQETRLRQLSIRTYKVVPLSQNSGLLQWCDGTKPLGDYLAGRQGDAHSRYNPYDWKVLYCRKHLHDAGPQPDKRFKAYQEICAHFHPVFRHFFMEKYVKPDEWFERRLVYTRSVATNSIVGYVLGLGDRHVNNILIDLKTAELVHIDFGIAFERGRILPTPETVPFRLTRDIVDGMGIPGVEGIFRRCCEKMMQVMKKNSEALLTIVQVLLHDPLSHWSLTPDEILSLEKLKKNGTSWLRGLCCDCGRSYEERKTVCLSVCQGRSISSSRGQWTHKIYVACMLDGKHTCD
ncbi:ATM serine/threonine kinase, partial [Elysia marginata]